MKTISTGLAAMLLCQQAFAQEMPDRRFHLEKTETGFVRLDTQTGAMALCREENSNLVCRMAADERAAYEQELDLLSKRVEALEKRLADAPATVKSLPDDEEIERSLGIMEKFMRMFFGLVEEFRDRSGQSPSGDRI